MADLFGDNLLFSEFKRERPACDTILKSSCEDQEGRRISHKNVSSSEASLDENALQGGQNDRGRAEGDRRNGEAKTEDYIKSLECEVERLKTLNAKLLAVNRLIAPTRIIESLKVGPCIQINYMNHAVSRRYKADIEELLSKKLKYEEESSKQANNRLPVLPLRPNYVSLGKQDTEDFGSATDSNTVIGNCLYYDLFIIDCIGWPLIEYNPSLSDGWTIPYYEQVFLDPLPCDETEEIQQEAKRDKRPKRTCFNCGGDHSLNVCKEPRNHKRIAESRLQFQQQSTASPQLKQSRYHVDEEPQFVGMKAGVISDSLRAALGLSHNQLPPYIYQMRLFGYPPGYLEEACQDLSGLSMFGKHGREIRKDGNALEDGEVDDVKLPSLAYDISKFVSYPGFNVELSPGTVDEYERFNMPPMQHNQHVDVMKCKYGPKTKMAEVGAKRQHSEQSEDGSGPAKMKRVDNDVVAEDMDLEDLDKSDITVSQITYCEAESGGNNISTPVNISSSNPPGASPAGNGGKETVPSACVTTPVLSTPVGRCGSVGYTLGTPLALDVSEDGTNNDASIKMLPERSSFSVGVSDHILYENLPNATGTFQRLRDVLRTLRDGSTTQRRVISPNSSATPAGIPRQS